MLLVYFILQLHSRIRIFFLQILEIFSCLLIYRDNITEKLLKYVIIKSQRRDNTYIDTINIDLKEATSWQHYTLQTRILRKKF